MPIDHPPKKNCPLASMRLSNQIVESKNKAMKLTKSTQSDPRSMGPKGKTLKESDLKALVLNELRMRKIITSNSILATEFLISHSNLRADLAILAEKFIGVEIKSELDTLRRLPSQLNGYRNVFEKVILVIAEKHWHAVRMKEFRNVEIWRVNDCGSLITIHPAVGGPNEVTPGSLVNLMTKRERSKFKIDLSSIPFASEKDVFSCAFKGRFAETSKEFWSKTRRKTMNGSDLKFLSRFADRRLLAEKIAKERHQQRGLIADRWLNTGITP